MNFLTELALYLKANKSGISKQEKNEMYDNFAKTSLYNPRKSYRDKPTDAVNHKLDGLNYFMFGYSSKLHGEDKFIFSPLGNLFLKYLSDEKALSKIFATMLVGLQLPHPASKHSEEFKVYPFRLIFQLLLDERLDGRLYHFEVYRYLIYIDQINVVSYEELVQKLLASRAESDLDKVLFLKEHEHQIVKTIFEWQYYISGLLEEINIIRKINGDRKLPLYHPTKEGSKSPPTKRFAHNGFFTLNKELIPLVKTLLKTYSVFDEPIQLIDSTRQTSDVVKEIYSFYPNELLVELGENVDTLHNKLLELPEMINQYSLNPENKTANRFEDVLEEAFNMFYNVEANKLAGSGRTDLECIHLDNKVKFAVEAKSTANKLSSINAGRLARHRELIGGKYTIVVTPKYVPSVRYDIKGQDVVIIKANTLSEYFYNNFISNNRNINYDEIHSIVCENLGHDISDKISELTLTKFG